MFMTRSYLFSTGWHNRVLFNDAICTWLSIRPASRFPRTIAEIQGTPVCETMTKSLDTTINSASWLGKIWRSYPPRLNFANFPPTVSAVYLTQILEIVQPVLPFQISPKFPMPLPWSFLDSGSKYWGSSTLVVMGVIRGRVWWWHKTSVVKTQCVVMTQNACGLHRLPLLNCKCPWRRFQITKSKIL